MMASGSQEAGAFDRLTRARAALAPYLNAASSADLIGQLARARAAIMPYLTGEAATEHPADLLGQPVYGPQSSCSCYMSDLSACQVHGPRPAPAQQPERREPSDEECRELLTRLNATDHSPYRDAIRAFVRKFSPPRGPVTWADLSEEQQDQIRQIVSLLVLVEEYRFQAGELARAFGLDEAAAREGRCVPKGESK